MTRSRIGAVLLSLTLVAGCRATSPEGPREGPEENPLIRSQVALDRYLTTHDQTPFDALSPGGRERLFGSLFFTERGLAGFSIAELVAELDYTQAEALLSLFGVESYLRTIFPDGPESRPAGSAYSKVEGPSQMDAPLKEFQTIERASRDATGEERGALLAAAYARLFPATGEADTQGLTAHDLRLQLRAANAVASEARDERNVDESVRLLLAISRIDELRKVDVEAVQSSLIKWRRFEDAASLAQRFPALLEPFPAFEPLDAPVSRSVWAFGAQRVLVQRAAPELTGTRLIVIGSPGCHFTRGAAEAIGADPELRKVLDGALWLVPEADPVRVDEVLLEWERRFAWAPLQYVNRESEWPEITDWGRPTFVFVKDGQVQRTITGWPPEGRKAELVKAAASVGMGRVE